MFEVDLDGTIHRIDIDAKAARERTGFYIKTAGQIALREADNKAGARQVGVCVNQMLSRHVAEARRDPSARNLADVFIGALAQSVVVKGVQSKDHYEMWKPLDGCTAVVTDTGVGILLAS